MNRARKGLTPFEILVLILLLILLVGGGVLWFRVTKLNTWAVATDAWLVDELYPWIRDNSFNGGGNPDGDKPPPPPDGLD